MNKQTQLLIGILIISCIINIYLYEQKVEIQDELSDYHKFACKIDASPYYAFVGNDYFIKDINVAIELIDDETGGFIISYGTTHRLSEPIYLKQNIDLYGINSTITAVAPMDAMIYMNNYTSIDGFGIKINNYSHTLIDVNKELTEVSISNNIIGYSIKWIYD